MKKVVIVGGGISGLATAYYLQKEAKNKGIDLKYWLVEKNNRFGGNIITEKTDNFIIEGGPDNFLSQKPWALNLCKELGLGQSILNTNPDGQTFVLWKRKLHPLPEGFILMIPTKIMPFITNNLFTLRGKLTMALDLIKRKGDPQRDESLSEFVHRRLGTEALDKIAEPLVAGIHAGNPDTMSVKSSYPRFVEMEQKHRSLIIAMLKARKQAKGAPTMFVTLKDGLSGLVYATTDKLDKNSLLKNTSVTNITKKNGKFTVSLENAESLEADSLIFTTPAHVSSYLLKEIDPEITEILNSIPYVSTATISLAYKKTAFTKPLNGFGFVVPKIEGRKIMAATFSSKKYAFRAPDDSELIRCFVGGSKNEELVDLSDEELIKISSEELAQILGIQGEPLLAKVFKWKKAMPQYVVSHSQKIARIEERLNRHPGLYLAGTAFKTGIADSIHNGEITAKHTLEKI